MEITAKCNACGSSQFRIPDEHEPDQTVYCASCGASVGDKASIRKGLAERGKKEIENMIKNTFKGSKGFKLK